MACVSGNEDALGTGGVGVESRADCHTELFARHGGQARLQVGIIHSRPVTPLKDAPPGQLEAGQVQCGPVVPSKPCLP